MRECIAVEKVVAIGLLKLCSVAEDRVVATVFGVGRSTVNGIYREFCEAVISVMEKDWLKMLRPADMDEHIREFMAVCDFPQAVGALDGCHFPVSPPEEHATDYYNYKGWHSIILLALVDHKYRFRYINFSFSGSRKYNSNNQLPQPVRSSDSEIGNAASVRSALVDYFRQRV
ncbi:uncharacterized protein LOC142574721 [Dermacentor variabilis]|uniref:uncharacterized protein LOC142574721 n=1 Tax=Dermacentor variabilis TaxID=34621 RepID=UPI003F5B7B07